MQIPRYWHKATAVVSIHGSAPFQIPCWGWSDLSPHEAKQHALQRSEQMPQLIDASGSQYPYGVTPPREEILQTITSPGGERLGVVSENAYGAVVLNTKAMFIADIDAAPQQTAPKSVGQWFQSLFGGAKSSPPQPKSQEDELHSRLDQVSTDGFRLYRTAAGWRVILVSRPVHGIDEESMQLLQLLGADPLYCRLCERQKCFREVNSQTVAMRPPQTNQPPPPRRGPASRARGLAGGIPSMLR